MKRRKIFTKTTLLLLTALLVLPLFQAHAAEPGEDSLNDIYRTYFTDKYPQLNDEDHLYRTLTYHELDHLLKSEGTYIVLFGGAWDSTTQAVIGYVNEVAKTYGIAAIHNFDPRLDGKSIDITDSANSPYSRRYVELVNKYLTNIGDHVASDERVAFSDTVTSGRAPNQVTKVIEGEALKIDTPFLFVYNKEHDGPIIASLEIANAFPIDAGAGESEVAEFKSKVGEVFEAVTGEVNVLDNNEYIASSYNEFAGTTIFDESDKEIVLDPVTYDELLQILDSEGNYVFLFGCSWCPNTRAVAKFVNEYAKKYNVDRVYNWDTKLDGGIGGTPGVEPGTDSANFLQTRTTGHPYAHVYVDLVHRYLPGIETLYDVESNNVSYIDSTGKEIVVNKLQVPYVFVYNKDHKDAEGNPDPIIAHVELMYTWDNIQPDYERAGKKGVNYNNYIAALDRMFSTLAGLLPQVAPQQIGGYLPTSATAHDGTITGTTTEMEYKRAEDLQYSPVLDTTIEQLTNGTYYIRYAAKEGYAPGPAVVLDLNLNQEAPVGLTGVAPTTIEGQDGIITGASNQLEYKPVGESAYKAAAGDEITPLAPGTYHVRVAAKYGYNAGPEIEVVVPEYAPIAFTDVPSTAWHHEAIRYLADRGIVEGVQGSAFSPDAQLTKGQFVVWLLQAYGITPETNVEEPFADARNGGDAPYLNTAKQLGLIQGDTENNIEPTAPLARQDLLVLLHQALEALDKLPEAATQAVLANYTDSAQIADHAREAFEIFVGSGVIAGYNAELNPQQWATRAEAAQILFNLLVK